MPFISDLRTGAMTGGSGEAAVANAAAAQLLLKMGLPSTVSAGMTDAKTADAQSGYEKGYTIALAAQAGADMINLSVGMLGSIMAASKEALVIDNDMCGAILRSVRGIDMPAGGIDLDMIEAVVTGEGPLPRHPANAGADDHRIRLSQARRPPKRQRLAAKWRQHRLGQGPHSRRRDRGEARAVASASRYRGRDSREPAHLPARTRESLSHEVERASGDHWRRCRRCLYSLPPRQGGG